MRAFDVLTKADYDIRGSTQPRYHLELALLRWVHLRRLVPLTDIIQGLDKGGASIPRAGAAAPARPASVPVAPRPVVKPPLSNAATVRAVETKRAESAAAKAEVEPPPPPAPAESRRRRPPRRAPCRIEGRARRGNAEDEEVLLRHGHRPGAAHRHRRRPHRPGLRAARAQAAARAEPPVARGDGLAPRRPQDDRRRRRRHRCRGAKAAATPPAARPPPRAISNRR